MSSTAPFARVLFPRSDAVAPNGAVVLEGHVLGPLSVAARVDGVPLGVRVEPLPRLDLSPNATQGRALYAVRPAAGEWPVGTLVELEWRHDALPPARCRLTVCATRDTTPPAFTSLGAVVAATREHPHGQTRVLELAHGAFVDPWSPIVVVTLALDPPGAHYAGAVTEGAPGALVLPFAEGEHRVKRVTVADLSGNAVTIDEPGATDEEPPPEEIPDFGGFCCLAGKLEAGEGEGEFVATTDGGRKDGFSRGHFLATRVTSGDLEVRVLVTRLTTKREMPLELVFRGGHFGVTGTSQWFLYEHAGHWTGWRPTPSPVREGENELRVVQRGQDVSAFLNGELVGSFRREWVASDERVGVYFKGRPGERARMRYRGFEVRALPADATPE